MELKKTVCYEDFGAAGDGIQNDADAIRAAHAYANEKGLKVVVDSTKTYYIPKIEKEIIIKTDVDFGTAEFIIDDTGDMEDRRLSIFNVESDYPKITIDNMPLVKKGQKKIDFP